MTPTTTPILDPRPELLFSFFGLEEESAHILLLQNPEIHWSSELHG